VSQGTSPVVSCIVFPLQKVGTAMQDESWFLPEDGISGALRKAIRMPTRSSTSSIALPDIVKSQKKTVKSSYFTSWSHAAIISDKPDDNLC
jgi:hypothetical protein